MAWFSKKKEGDEIGELPELPQLSQMPNPYIEKDAVPSITPPPKGNDNMVMNSRDVQKPAASSRGNIKPFQPHDVMQKSIVEDEREDSGLGFKPADSSTLPSLKSESPAEMMAPKTITPSKPIAPKPAEPKPMATKTIPTPPKTSGKQLPRITHSTKQGPIYIRLDKFETTVETFDNIKEKVEELEDVLAKTKQIRAKEDQELESWEQEIQIIKSRIETIDKNLLGQFD